MLTAQILAVAIFVIMFGVMISEKIEKHWVTLGAGVLTIILVFGVAMQSRDALFETLNLKGIITKDFWITSGEGGESSTGINWATIIFLGGMMIMVEGMAKAGFFRWLCLKLAKLVNYKPIPLFLTFMIMSAVLSMFIDSITVILFLAAVTIELAKLLKIDPVPMILAEVFCANLGGSATMCGDPPNIIIGTGLGYSFFDFLTNTGVIAGICLVFIILYYYIIFRKAILPKAGEKIDFSTIPNPSDAIESKKDFTISCVIFAIAVVLLVTHSMTGLTVAFIGTFIAIITLITAGKNVLIILKKVDYQTLIFFTGLFIVVGGLEQTGILEAIASFIGKISGGNIYIMVAVIMWISAIASAFVDNIPFAATMLPIIKSLAGTNSPMLSCLAWTLSIGTDICGSATPIGASANVVGTSIAAKKGYPIGWGKYCKSAAPATVIVITVSMIYVFIRYCGGVEV
ncbi:MAG: anion permease [Ruminococcus sp.]|nr:anion permease [Ruminococcus sp.]